jgi:L-lysine exporter family protein LysE/ArgO
MAFVAGLALGLSLIVAIGAQNAFVLRQGIRGEHVLAVCLACALSDALLIAVGVGGFGAISRIAPWTVALMRWGGVAFLTVYGALSFRAAWHGGGELATGGGASRPLGPTLATCLALTWLNPHVYLDTVVLLGSVAVEWRGQRLGFALGAITGSFLFFFALGYGARLLAPVFARPVAWRILEAGVGAVMWAIALRLAVG